MHAADIRINHRGAQTEREHANRRCRVGAHARQSQQLLVVGGNLTAVLLHNRHSGTVQTLRAARVTQPAPGAHRLRGGLGGKVGGGGPAAHPLLPHGQDALNGGLLQHELADHHTPGGALVATPRQIACLVEEPPVDSVVERLDVGAFGQGGFGACACGAFGL